MNGPGYQVLPGTAFTLEQNGCGIACRDPVYYPEHVLHTFAFSHDVLELAFSCLLVTHPHELAFHACSFQGFFDYYLQFFKIYRLYHVIIGPGLHARYPGRNGVVSSDHDNGNVTVELFYLLEDIQTAYIGKANIKQDEVHNFGLSRQDRFFTAIHALYFIPRLCEVTLHGPADQVLIINN